MLSNIHDNDKSGTTPIIAASTVGCIPLVELLLSKGANIHNKNEQGDTDIISCKEWSPIYGSVELLLSQGASVNDLGKDRNIGNVQERYVRGLGAPLYSYFYLLFTNVDPLP